ncbi:MAG: hypothetical protein IPI02_21250 [Sterolibacteriaceae bacterium]|nr:hypothetical protein [Sterolibacteriaceae bacterium]
MMSDEELQRLFVKDVATGKIHFTRKGVEAFGRDFAEVGFDITKITTQAQFEAASDARLAFELRRSAQEVRGKQPALEAIMCTLPGWGSHERP